MPLPVASVPASGMTPHATKPRNLDTDAQEPLEQHGYVSEPTKSLHRVSKVVSRSWEGPNYQTQLWDATDTRTAVRSCGCGMPLPRCSASQLTAEMIPAQSSLLPSSHGWSVAWCIQELPDHRRPLTTTKESSNRPCLVEQRMWGDFLSQVEALAQRHPYTASPGAKQCCEWGACGIFGANALSFLLRA